MKVFAILFVVAVLSIQCTNRNVHNPINVAKERSKKDGYVLSVDQSKISKLHDIDFPRLKRVFDVFVKLTNNSDSILTYASMSCSYNDFYTTNKRAIANAGSICEKNIPVTLTLPPHQSATVDLLLRIPENIKLIHNIHFRVGMSLHTKPQSDFEPNWSNIIWSNEISTP